jgi:hypothetical protein
MVTGDISICEMHNTQASWARVRPQFTRFFFFCIFFSVVFQKMAPPPRRPPARFLVSAGLNNHGTLGTGRSAEQLPHSSRPRTVAPLPRAAVLSMSAGEWHTAVVMHARGSGDGSVLVTWGMGDNGRLGHGSVHSLSAPSEVDLSHLAGVVAKPGSCVIFMFFFSFFFFFLSFHVPSSGS